MKLYLAASLIAIGALAYIAANEPPARAAAIAVAAAGWPDETAAMARRTGPRWLLRAMPMTGPRGTLATLPDDGLTKAQPL